MAPTSRTLVKETEWSDIDGRRVEKIDLAGDEDNEKVLDDPFATSDEKTEGRRPSVTTKTIKTTPPPQKMKPTIDLTDILSSASENESDTDADSELSAVWKLFGITPRKNAASESTNTKKSHEKNKADSVYGDDDSAAYGDDEQASSLTPDTSLSRTSSAAVRSKYFQPRTLTPKQQDARVFPVSLPATSHGGGNTNKHDFPGRFAVVVTAPTRRASLPTPSISARKSGTTPHRRASAGIAPPFLTMRTSYDHKSIYVLSAMVPASSGGSKSKTIGFLLPLKPADVMFITRSGYIDQDYPTMSLPGSNSATLPRYKIINNHEYTDKVRKMCVELGYELRRDNMDTSFSSSNPAGQVYCSHVEKQLVVVAVEQSGVHPFHSASKNTSDGFGTMVNQFRYLPKIERTVYLDHKPCGHCEGFRDAVSVKTGVLVHIVSIPRVQMEEKIKMKVAGLLANGRSLTETTLVPSPGSCGATKRRERDASPSAEAMERRQVKRQAQARIAARSSGGDNSSSDAEDVAFIHDHIRRIKPEPPIPKKSYIINNPRPLPGGMKMNKYYMTRARNIMIDVGMLDEGVKKDRTPKRGRRLRRGVAV